MPGVPSSRGCDACRRQKKKCDQAKPACGRCERLQVECTGAGQQRYKFHNQTAVPHQPARRKLPASSPPAPSHGTDLVSMSPYPSTRGLLGSSPAVAFQRRRPLLLPPPPTGNAQTAVCGRLVSALEVSDPRYNLSVYGSFLRDIPQRIGSSPALDAAASAMAVILPLAMEKPTIDSRPLRPSDRPTVPMLQQYGKALTALRGSLSDPIAIADPNTLCALYVVVICQGWLRHEDGHVPSHMEAVATILRAMKGRNTTRGPFEQKIMSTLGFLVLMESFINARIQLDEDVWFVPEPYGPPSATAEPANISSLSNRVLSRISRLLRSPEPKELAEAYDLVRLDRAKLANLIASIPLAPSRDGRVVKPASEALCHIHLRWQTAYALLTLLAMRVAVGLAGAASHSSKGSHPSDLTADFQIYINDIATVAEQAMQYHPLGSSVMPLCILAAYASLGIARGDPSQRTRLIQIFSDYRPGTDLDREWATVAQTINPASGAAPCPALGSSREDRTQAISNEAICSIM